MEVTILEELGKKLENFVSIPEGVKALTSEAKEILENLPLINQDYELPDQISRLVTYIHTHMETRRTNNINTNPNHTRSRRSTKKIIKDGNGQKN